MIKPEERLDKIGFGDLCVIQNPKWFCYGVDAVLIAHFAGNRKARRIVDLGTGTGIIPLILYHKSSPKEIIGVEVQANVAEMAQRTMKLNGLDSNIIIACCDVKQAPERLGTGEYDVVVSNPPYMASGGGISCPRKEKNASRHETTATLEDFVKTAAELLTHKGEFYMIHRPNRMVDVLTLCRKYSLEPKRIQMIQPKPNVKPNIFMVQCSKNGGRELTFLNPLCVYDEDGQYSEEILQIYERIRTP